MVRNFNTQVLKIDPNTIVFDNNQLTITDENTKQALDKACTYLKESEVVAFPTETVYGLGASSLSSKGVLKIYEAKNRPSDNPLISHISNVNMIKDIFHSEIPEIYKPLISKFWPGPLTIILPINKDCKISKYVTGNQETFAVRLPENKIARSLIQLSNLPLAAPSANSSTKPSPTTAEHVLHDLNGKIPLILDGGKCNVGLESTVVDGTVYPPMLLRPGGISLEEIQKIGYGWENIILGKKTAGKFEKVRTPGMKYKHYSPNAKVILFENFKTLESAIEKFLGIHKLDNDEIDLRLLKIAILTCKNWDADKIEENSMFDMVVSLGKTGDQIQRNLFSALRDADESKIDLIFVEGVSEDNQGLAIMNRLSKAASETIVC